ncbi:DNA polymerase I isoform X2 [Tripterygium wilfordii]|uniref:DNA polymerase I isoform X2 n=1 Tax=Tripterygium wilfordii TaxID=458696 RepID=UPI0018F84256|nr:DNA polymerase I isoform X2 [Tripterygium wilfordii]
MRVSLRKGRVYEREVFLTWKASLNLKICYASAHLSPRPPFPSYVLLCQAIVQHYGEQYLTSSIVGHGLNVNRFPSFQIRQMKLALGSHTSHKFKISGGCQVSLKGDENKEAEEKRKQSKKKRVFFLDVNPLCYAGSKASLHSFGRWISLFFDQVSHSEPVIAVLDGEGGYEHRRQILPSYKAHRRKFLRQIWTNQKLSKCNVGSSHQVVTDVLRKCNVPVIKIDGHEADDVVATLVSQVVKRGYRAVIASPDKDFKQLISEDVQIVMPLAELDRWSFYTLKHYIAQYNCDPLSDLSLRCIIGDDVDGVPGIQHVVPGFGRKTAVKLLKKHGSLEKLLNAASVRTVGRSYAQDALKNYADYLRRNYEVLALRRDVDIHLEDDWLEERDTHSDSNALANLFRSLEETQKCIHQNKSHSSKV